MGVPFTPVAGARFLTAAGEDRRAHIAQLARALQAICRENGLSGVHANFLLEDEQAVLAEEGWLPRLGFQYHWRNRGFADFEGYLGSLRSKRRNQVRRERRELERQGVRIERWVGEQIPNELFPLMYRIYRSTVDANPWGRPYLNARFFELLRERFRQRICFIVARQDREILAGTVNVQKGDSLYGRYWGTLRPLRHLHFNVCYYAGIEHCIQAGLQRFEPGAGGPYKQLRGFDATPVWSCHHLEDPRLAAAVAQYLEQERSEAREAIEWYGEHSANRRAEA